MDRIKTRFAELKRTGRKGLITFIMGGDPDSARSQALLDALPKAGADLIEIGMPFSDPMADGPAIQAAGLRALASGATLASVLAQVKRFRKQDPATPVILMGYYNPIYRYGVETFCNDAAACGADGVILVDLPPEEEDEFTKHAEPCGLHLIRLIAPTTDASRLKLLVRRAGGFLYYISITGVTGTASAKSKDVKSGIALLRAHSPLPIAAGFGIKTPQQAADAARYSDAVVVGSALVDMAARSTNAAITFVRSLRKALDS